MKCNVCGKTYEDKGAHPYKYYNEQMHKFTVTFEYGSKFDTQQWEFWKCENCLIEEVEHFVILPKINSYDFFN
jgi:hypothetical protein